MTSIATCLVAAACVVPSASRARLTHADRSAELARAGEAAARETARGHFAEVFASLFGATGVYITAGPAIAPGPESVLKFLEMDSLNAQSSMRWTTLRLDVSADGRDGFSYGYFDVIRANGDSQPGRYHAYWRRSARGRWELLAFTRGKRTAGPLNAALHPDVARVRSDSPPPAYDTTASIAELRATEAAFSTMAGTSLTHAFSRFAAPDAAKFGGQSTFVFGPESIGELFSDVRTGAGPVWRPEVVSVAASNDLGFTFGPAWSRNASDPPANSGRYFTIWRRQPDGQWKFVVD
jgi:ketosteroid isomerase-like protein